MYHYLNRLKTVILQLLEEEVISQKFKFLTLLQIKNFRLLLILNPLNNKVFPPLIKSKKQFKIKMMF